MSFLLKIVEGPNKGAEAALVEGVAVTIGKGDDCDIVLADSALPETPLKIETTAEGVSIDGELLEQLHVKTIGDTSFAVGPSEGSWGKLVWPNADANAGAKEQEVSEPVKAKTVEEGKSEVPVEKKKGHGCLAGFIVLMVLTAILVGLGFYFREWLMPRVEPYRPQAKAVWNWTKSHTKIAYKWCAVNGNLLYEKVVTLISDEKEPAVEVVQRDPAEIIAEIALANGLSIEEVDGRLAVSGNLKTRAERLKVTADAYAALPYVALSLSDDETLRTAVEDTLMLIGETGVKVSWVTNRVVKLEGRCSNPATLKSRVSQEVPKIRLVEGLDTSSVAVVSDVDAAETEIKAVESAPIVTEYEAPSVPQVAPPVLPVCGILTMPYPCLVTRSGMRIMEGASIGDWTVVKIGADSVVLENAGERYVWKP